MKENKPKKICGLFVFTPSKDLLLVKHYDSKHWEIPTWEHSGNEDYLMVAQVGIFEKTGIEFFNYKDELFKPLKHQFGKTVFIPYVIFNEKDMGEDFIPYDDRIDYIDFIPLSQCKNKLGCNLQKKALSQIKFQK